MTGTVSSAGLPVTRCPLEGQGYTVTEREREGDGGGKRGKNKGSRELPKGPSGGMERWREARGSQREVGNARW